VVQGKIRPRCLSD